MSALPTQNKKVHSFSCAPKISSPQENSWFALRATKEKIAQKGDNFRFSSDLVEIYELARTYFERES